MVHISRKKYITFLIGNIHEKFIDEVLFKNFIRNMGHITSFGIGYETITVLRESFLEKEQGFLLSNYERIEAYINLK